METEFKQMSFDAKFHDVQGKNYKFTIPKLNKEIVPEKSKVLVKPSRVVVTLYKASKGNWLDLHFKEDKLKPNLGKEKDPMAGIMDLMKDGVFRIDRLESLLTESLRARAGKALVKEQTGDTDSKLKEILSFALTEKGAFVREILLQEFAKGLDALSLATLDSLPSVSLKDQSGVVFSTAMGRTLHGRVMLYERGVIATDLKDK